MIGNVVLQVNKFRYKDGKGDPKGFKVFLSDNNLPKGIIPRYRGNRLHVLFHICGKLHEYHDLFMEFFTNGTVSCGGLQASLRSDFGSATARVQGQCLGLIGKLLTGPWMEVFYTSASSQIDHIHGISVVRCVLSAVKDASDDPLSLLTTECDLFGRQLEDNSTLASLRAQPLDCQLFKDMMAVSLKSVITVLERQYKCYFEMDIDDKLRKETESARSHNIDSEEMMGMFSSAQERAKNATVYFLAARIRARKNRVVAYLDGMYEEKRESVVKWAIGRAREKRKLKKQKQNELRQELSKRSAVKRQKKSQSAQKQLEKKLQSVDLKNIASAFPELSEMEVSTLEDILSGKIIGRNLCHTWYDIDKNTQSTWNGRILKLKQVRRVPFYKISYWEDDETFENATDFEISKWALSADFISKDLVLC